MSVRINFDDEAKLISLKGVGKTTAHNIIKFRTTAGNITQETLKDISGIHVSSELLAGIDFSINPDLCVPPVEDIGQGEQSQKVVTQQEVIKKLEKVIEAHTGGESQGQGQPKVSLAVSKPTFTQGAIPKGSNSKSVMITSMSSVSGVNQQNDTGLNASSPPSMLEVSAMGGTPYNVGITTPAVTVWSKPPTCMSYPPPGIQSCMTPCSQGIGYGPIPNFQPQYGLPNFGMAPPPYPQHNLGYFGYPPYNHMMNHNVHSPAAYYPGSPHINNQFQHQPSVSIPTTGDAMNDYFMHCGGQGQGSYGAVQQEAHHVNPMTPQGHLTQGHMPCQGQGQVQGQIQGHALGQGQVQGQIQGHAPGQGQGQIQGHAQGQGQIQGYAQGQGHVQGQGRAQGNMPAFHNQAPQGQGRARVDPLPKSLKFTGDGDWDAFQLKFTRYMEMKNWTPAEAKDYLCFALEGKASEYFATIINREAAVGYAELMQKLDKRFGQKEIPQTAQVKLLTLKQGSGQSIEDWADEVLQLASKAYRELPEAFMYEQAINRICHGCRDKEAGQFAVNLGLDTIESVIDKIKSYQYNKQAMMEGPKRDVREASCYYETDSDGEEQVSARVSRRDMWQKRETRIPNNTSRQSNTSSFPTSSETGQGHMGELKNELKAIRKMLELLTSHDQRHTSPSPSRGRSPSPRRDGACYQCGGQGHFKKDCPLLIEGNKPAKKVSFQENGNGLRM